MYNLRRKIAALLIRLAFLVSDDLYWDISLNLRDLLYFAHDWAHDRECDARTREYKVADRFIRLNAIRARRAMQALDEIANPRLAQDEQQLLYQEKLELDAIKRDCSY
jgi:hypothetical protein